MFTKRKLDVTNEENDPRNVHVNMYNYTKKFKQLLTITLTITIAALAILSVGVFASFSGFEDRISESGTYTELYGSDCAGRGYEPAENQECYLFVPSDGGAPLGITVGELINHHYIVAGWITMGVIVLAISLICTVVYSRKMKEPLDETLDQYIQESYLLNIQLTSPKGTTRAERIANLLWSVFPEVYSVSENISEDQEVTKIPYSINEKKGGYVFDLYMEAEDVKFGAIFFKGEFTLEKLKEFTDSVKGDFEGGDHRVICIAKKFDVGLSEIAAMPSDAEIEEDELLEEQFNGLNVDILKEDDKNQFSIVWIS